MSTCRRLPETRRRAPHMLRFRCETGWQFSCLSIRCTHMAVANMEMMVVESGAADTLAVVGDEARRLLTSVGRPIVVMPKRLGHGFAEPVAPHNRTIGLFLPYSPRLIDIDTCAASVRVCTDADRGIVMVTGFDRRLVAEPDGELPPRIC